MDPAERLDAQMVAYYAARAPEYDEWYLRSDRYVHTEADDAAWKADLDRAARWLAEMPMGSEIVELAAGTGWWPGGIGRRHRTGRRCRVRGLRDELAARGPLAVFEWLQRFVRHSWVGW